MKKTQSNQWSRGFGFVVVSAGAAVGMGNLWRFPMLVGQNGGGAFVTVYLICLFLIGIPMLIAEIAIGRHSGKDVYESYRAVNPKWGAVGILAVATSLLGLSYYTVLGGWVLRYTLGGTGKNPAAFFSSFTASPARQILFYLITMGITALIVMCGVKKGIERACKWMMPLLLLFLLILAVRACTLPGAKEGIRFFLKPDFSKLTPKIWIMALGQVFFSLSIGAGAGITYGAYLSKKESIPKQAALVAGFDTLAALLAGLAILPAVFSAGMQPETGPGLLFQVLPGVFQTMPLGTVFSFFFFLMVLFASFTTTIAFLEVAVAFAMNRWHWGRKKATLICALTAALLGLPAALSFGVLREVKLFGKTWFDLADYTVSNLALPIAAILTCLFIGLIWKRKNAVNEITNGGSLRFFAAKPWALWVSCALPLVIFIIFLTSIGVIR